MPKRTNRQLQNITMPAVQDEIDRAQSAFLAAPVTDQIDEAEGFWIMLGALINVSNTLTKIKVLSYASFGDILINAVEPEGTQLIEDQKDLLNAYNALTLFAPMFKPFHDQIQVGINGCRNAIYEAVKLNDGGDALRKLFPDERLALVRESSRPGRGKMLSDVERLVAPAVLEIRKSGSRWPDTIRKLKARLLLADQNKAVQDALEWLNDDQTKITYKLKQAVVRYRRFCE